jgi:hypothetical protein
MTIATQTPTAGPTSQLARPAQPVSSVAIAFPASTTSSHMPAIAIVRPSRTWPAAAFIA